MHICVFLFPLMALFLCAPFLLCAHAHPHKCGIVFYCFHATSIAFKIYVILRKCAGKYLQQISGLQRDLQLRKVSANCVVFCYFSFGNCD